MKEIEGPVSAASILKSQRSPRENDLKLSPPLAIPRRYLFGFSRRFRLCEVVLLLALSLLSSPLAAQIGPIPFTDTGSLAHARAKHTATLLAGGKVLVTGGSDSSPLASAELYDPASGTWAAAGSLVTARQAHTATMLTNGKVLIAGGFNLGVNGASLSTAELYDPATGLSTATGSLATPRDSHTATLLPNGKVLVVGGNMSSFLASAELYDPASGLWTATGSLATARQGQTATLLPNGKVLVAGGSVDSSGSVSSAELYDPASGLWTATGSPATPRSWHTATLLANGKVMVAGGLRYGAGLRTYLTDAELYDSTSGTWTATGSLSAARAFHTATSLSDGKVLIIGGAIFDVDLGQVILASAEVYDSASGTWAVTGSLATGSVHHTATLLSDGNVLVSGGEDIYSYHKSAELYDPASGIWTITGGLTVPRIQHTATLLADGKVLLAGGNSNGVALTSAEVYDPASGLWTVTGSLADARIAHTETLLPNGKVLIAGGFNINGGSLSSAELYDPVSRAWMGTGSLISKHHNTHTATLLPDGRVLVAGGDNETSAELYDPANETWTATGSLVTARGLHTATLLPNGQVLVVGGYNYSGKIASAELYDPVNGAWRETASLNTGRGLHTATLLPNGKVLVAGGLGIDDLTSSAELYDPASGKWTGTGSLNTARDSHTATLLANGKVLVAGGDSVNGISASAELYDPASGTWKETGGFNNARAVHTATLLPTGNVLAAGANFSPNVTAELYSTSLAEIPTSHLLNISTRLRVLTDNNVLIGGFIITGSDPKKVLLRGIGPSLTNVGNTLPDPNIELYQGGIRLVGNDNWKTRSDGSSQQVEIESSGIPPTNDLESALIATLSPGSYTTILSGNNRSVGVGLLEAYDITFGVSNSKLANISTRGFVDTADNVMIGGFIAGPSDTGMTTVLVRAIGPSLINAGIDGPLLDPFLEVRDGNGVKVMFNDNWKTREDGNSQQAEIEATGIPPADDRESADIETLAPGGYTVIVRGVNDTTGVGLVEVYNL